MIKQDTRNNGLDTLRSIAILLVFLYHFSMISYTDTFGYISQIGWIGVDLFFALSGYLITNQIFSQIQQGKFKSSKFFMRRLFRTLPNYLVVLAIYFFIPSFAERGSLPPIWQMLSFTFSLFPHTNVAFSHSWSLCIEEQYYLVIPLVILGLSNLNSKRLAWLVISLSIVGGMLLRGYIWLRFVHGTTNNSILNITDYWTKIYYFTFSRLDELTFGVSIAFIKNHYRSIWHKLVKNGNWCLIWGLIISFFASYMFYINQFSLIANIIGFPMLGIGYAMLIIASFDNSTLIAKKIPGAKHVALLSFAIYLVQKPLDHLAAEFLMKQYLVPRTSIILFISSIIITTFGASLLYFLIEKPFLALRDKLLN